MADYKLSNATPTEHASNISRLIPDWCIGMVDPAGAGENMHSKEKTFDFLTERSGLQLVKANKANHAKEAMIDEIYERVRGDRFKIFWTDTSSPGKGRGCRHLVTEWRQYARDENGLILKKNDHCMDALFYALNGLPHARTETQFYQEQGNRWGEAGYL